MTRPLVLIVEDDMAVRQPLEKFFALNGFEVATAETAEEAKALVAARAPDAAVVDLRLPQGSGRDVVAAIPSSIAVIIFSGVPDESGQLEHTRPNTRLILKPFSLLMLVELLQRMMDGAARHDPTPRRIATS